jgi:hypothetical protein
MMSGLKSVPCALLFAALIKMRLIYLSKIFYHMASAKLNSNAED